MKLQLDLNEMMFEVDEPILNLHKLNINQKDKIREAILEKIEEVLDNAVSEEENIFKDICTISSIAYPQNTEIFSGMICMLNNGDSVDIGIVVEKDRQGFSDENKYSIYLPLEGKQIKAVNANKIYKCLPENERNFTKLLSSKAVDINSIEDLKNFIIVKKNSTLYLVKFSMIDNSSCSLITVTFNSKESMGIKLSKSNTVNFLN